MRLMIGIMSLILIIGLAESVQVGGTASKVLLLGSVSTNIQNQTNDSNQMNITNQTNLGIAINKSMSPSPAINKYNKGIMPNNIEANSIVYRFTT